MFKVFTNGTTMSKCAEHHRRREYCKTRLQYRKGRELKAVKVYTVADESLSLLIFGVPTINLINELKRSLVRFGPLQFIKCATDDLSRQVELEKFTDVFHVKFLKIEHARRAKRILDAEQFYGGILHISYAPEFEEPLELRAKLQQRQQEVSFRQRANAKKAQRVAKVTNA